jgi:hypothetical protein
MLARGRGRSRRAAFRVTRLGECGEALDRENPEGSNAQGTTQGRQAKSVDRRICPVALSSSSKLRDSRRSLTYPGDSNTEPIGPNKGPTKERGALRWNWL